MKLSAPKKWRPRADGLSPLLWLKATRLRQLSKEFANWFIESMNRWINCMDAGRPPTETAETPNVLEASLESFLAPLASHPALRAAREAAVATASGLRGPITISGLTAAAKAFVA